MNITQQKECRVCKGELKDVLKLGSVYRSYFYKTKEEVDDEIRVPLTLTKCEQCGLIQLKDNVDLDKMYKEQYWYSSALNKSMISSLKDIVVEVETKVNLKDGDTVLDIGCNDGTLLSLYNNFLGLHKVGYDPAPNLKPNFDVHFINDYFSKEKFKEQFGETKAKVITAIAMFYDLPNPHKFVQDVKDILADDGIFIVQFTDLLSMFKTTAFDNICHEHLEYYTLANLISLLSQHNLFINDVSYNDVNGGSIRITASHKVSLTKELSDTIYEETKFLDKFTIEDFVDDIGNCIIAMRVFLAASKDKKVFLLGASTKGNTFLQICKITSEEVPYAAEVNKDKFGLKTLGSDIEIISEEEAFAMNPDFFIVPVWHFEKNLLTKKHIIDYIENGGKLVFPLPKFHIVGKEELDGRLR